MPSTHRPLRVVQAKGAGSSNKVSTTLLDIWPILQLIIGIFSLVSVANFDENWHLTSAFHQVFLDNIQSIEIGVERMKLWRLHHALHAPICSYKVNSYSWDLTYTSYRSDIYDSSVGIGDFPSACVHQRNFNCIITIFCKKAERIQPAKKSGFHGSPSHFFRFQFEGISQFLEE